MKANNSRSGKSRQGFAGHVLGKALRGMKIEIPKKDPMPQRARRSEYRRVYGRLPAYVQRVLYVHDIAPRKATFWKKGISSFVFRLEGEKDLALKISPYYGLFAELSFFRRAKSAGLPVPSILVADTSKKLIPHDFYVAEWIRGKAPDELRDGDLYDCAFALGRMFVRLHKVRTNGYGFPKPDGGWSHPSWDRALRDFVRRETSPSRIRRLFGRNVAGLIRDIILDRRMTVRRPSLIHGDAGEDQFVVERKGSSWRVKGILDPSDYISGDPMADVASAMITWNKEAYRRGFYDGYVASRALDEHERYRLRRLLFVSQAWAASVVYQADKADGKVMARHALRLAKHSGFLPA